MLFPSILFFISISVDKTQTKLLQPAQFCMWPTASLFSCRQVFPCLCLHDALPALLFVCSSYETWRQAQQEQTYRQVNKIDYFPPPLPGALFCRAVHKNRSIAICKRKGKKNPLCNLQINQIVLDRTGGTFAAEAIPLQANNMEAIVFRPAGGERLHITRVRLTGRQCRYESPIDKKVLCGIRILLLAMPIVQWEAFREGAKGIAGSQRRFKLL